ncbi:MAG: iron ABC transporter permease [Halioglobus sp.]
MQVYKRAEVLTISWRLPSKWLLATLTFALLPAVLLGLSQGAADLPLVDVFAALVKPSLSDTNQQAVLIVQEIRLPRVLLAATVGAILALSGAAMQGLFRNPLADPSLIGVTAGASLGAAIVIVVAGLNVSAEFQLPLISAGAFAGGLLAVILVYRLATSPNGTSVATMLLAGIAITALAGALGGLLEFQANNDMLRRISLWKMGAIDSASYSRLALAAVTCLILGLTIPRFAHALDAMLLGESEARHLGIDTDRVKRILVILVALGVGVCVALAGTIAFVGLVVPHLVRLLIGPAHKALLPASALAGALLLILADTLSRTLLAPAEIPVGIITAILGVPFFIVLLRQRHQYGMQT